MRIGGDEISAWVRRRAGRALSRARLVFYEWLMDERLALPDADDRQLRGCARSRLTIASAHPSLPGDTTCITTFLAFAISAP